jgi:hypothetical protein
MRESWVRNGYDASWIREDPDDYDAEGKSLAEPDKLFSPQNGLLLDVAAKLDWDVFRVTVDPDVCITLHLDHYSAWFLLPSSLFSLRV